MSFTFVVGRRQLHSDRPPLPDVPAVYFIEPTSDNLKRVADDLQKSTYETVHLNFTSSLPRPLLEEFAARVARDGTAGCISQVYDQYLDYIVLEPHLFSLLPGPQLSPSSAASTANASSATGGKDSQPGQSGSTTTYERLHDVRCKQEDVEAETDRIANGLFSMMATLSALPIVRCPRGNAAEMVARKLEGKIQDHIAQSKSSSNLFSGQASNAWSSHRPSEYRCTAGCEQTSIKD